MVGSGYTRHWKSDVMHHGGVQGYQVKDDSNESNYHMMPLPGSCFCNHRLVYFMCDACETPDVTEV
jgi:hypothetical protein